MSRYNKLAEKSLTDSSILETRKVIVHIDKSLSVAIKCLTAQRNTLRMSRIGSFIGPSGLNITQSLAEKSAQTKCLIKLAQEIK